jgi:formiminotetrahydrofolate cyclodeaminase
VSQTQKLVAGFLTDLSSRAATPGGGSASALVGAIAAALCGMVGRLNDKKDGAPGPLHETIPEADGLMERLKSLVDEDIAAFNDLAASWKLPDDAAHASQKQAAIIRATKIPLDIMAEAADLMHIAVEGLSKSKKNCLSDAGVAGILAHAALEAARLNVMINLPGISDPAIRSELSSHARTLLDHGNASRLHIDRLITANYSE